MNQIVKITYDYFDNQLILKLKDGSRRKCQLHEEFELILKDGCVQKEKKEV